MIPTTDFATHAMMIAYITTICAGALILMAFVLGSPLEE
jgi:hypothetical protein